MITDPYHRWLIKQRIYCERDACFREPTCVVKFNGRDTVLCDEHAGRIEAVRRSEEKQQQPISEQPVMDWLESLPKEDADQMRQIMTLMSLREERDAKQQTPIK